MQWICSTCNHKNYILYYSNLVTLILQYDWSTTVEKYTVFDNNQLHKEHMALIMASE